MNPISKKNLQQGEAVICHPKLHPIILLRPILTLLLSLFVYITIEVLLIFVQAFSQHFPSNILSSFMNIFFTCNLIFAGILFIINLIEYMQVEYYITNKRLIFKTCNFFSEGIISIKIIDLPIDKIESIIYEQNLFGYIFNYGSIYISGIGCIFPKYKTIRNPKYIRRKINEVIEKNRKITVIRSDNPKPKPIIKEKIIDIEYGIFVTSYPSDKWVITIYIWKEVYRLVIFMP